MTEISEIMQTTGVVSITVERVAHWNIGDTIIWSFIIGTGLTIFLLNRRYHFFKRSGIINKTKEVKA